MPPEFEGAWIYAGQGDGWVDFKVIRTGRLYVACNYTYQGNPDGGWLGSVWLPEDFIKNGWAPVAGLRLVGWNDREHQFFSRWCEQGETFRFRCNKYESPYVIHF